jgi:hypothetical protein
MYAHSHPYKHTYANHNTISIFERLMSVHLDIDKVTICVSLSMETIISLPSSLYWFGVWTSKRRLSIQKYDPRHAWLPPILGPISLYYHLYFMIFFLLNKHWLRPAAEPTTEGIEPVVHGPLKTKCIRPAGPWPTKHTDLCLREENSRRTNDPSSAL